MAFKLRRYDNRWKWLRSVDSYTRQSNPLLEQYSVEGSNNDGFYRQYRGLNSTELDKVWKLRDAMQSSRIRVATMVESLT